MHYRNGRQAKNGDRVVLIGLDKFPVTGVLYGATPGNNFCNGRLAQIRETDPVANLCECLHADDIAAATVPDATAIRAVDVQPQVPLADSPANAPAETSTPPPVDAAGIRDVPVEAPAMRTGFVTSV